MISWVHTQAINHGKMEPKGSLDSEREWRIHVDDFEVLEVQTSGRSLTFVQNECL